MSFITARIIASLNKCHNLSDVSGSTGNLTTIVIDKEANVFCEVIDVLHFFAVMKSRDVGD